MKFGLCFLLAVLAVPQTGFPQIQQSGPPMFDRNPLVVASGLEIPFKLYQGYLIVVQGSLGTLDRLNFLVDTGVNRTKVDSRIAKKLGLTAAAGAIHQLALFNQNLDVGQVVLPSIKLGPIRAESLPGIVLDLSTFEKILGVRIDASLGFDVLSRSSFSIDYKSRKIVFGPIEPSPLSVPFQTGPPILTVELKVQGEPIRLLVDTGAAELVLFQCQLPSRVRQLQASSVKRSFLNGAGQEVGFAEVKLPGVRLGSTEFGPQKGFETDDNANCGRTFDGVVGVTRLGLKWVGFDFEHRRFSWKT